jgi:hypothetical protein
MTLRITGFLDFAHRPEFWELWNRMFRKLDLFPSQGEGTESSALRGPLERGNLSDWAPQSWCIPPSPEAGKRCSVRNVVFSSI